ncbi:MAG: hypothetical protein QM484_06630 [Woeseiaceae bacterium]
MKRFASNQLMLRSFMLLIVFVGLQACSGGGGAANVAPVVSAVSITDDNGGTATYKDSLTATYTYNDVDGDAEGTSTFTWLRNGTAITGATASTYTLTLLDSEQAITLSVTAIASAGTTTGNQETSSAITVDVLPDQDGSGIYKGTATVDVNTDITDLRGIIYGGRFLFFSETATPHVLYDGTITAITKNTYTATVDVYENGVLTVAKTGISMTGSVLTSDTITGIIGTNGDAGNHNGAFVLTFDSAYNRAGTTARAETGLSAMWSAYGTQDISPMEFYSRADFRFIVSDVGGAGCYVSDVYTIPDATVNVYKVDNFDIIDTGGDACLDSYEGTGYSGLFSLFDDATDGEDSRMLVAYSNGTNSVFGLVTRQ